MYIYYILYELWSFKKTKSYPYYKFNFSHTIVRYAKNSRSQDTKEQNTDMRQARHSLKARHPYPKGRSKAAG